MRKEAELKSSDEKPVRKEAELKSSDQKPVRNILLVRLKACEERGRA